MNEKKIKWEEKSRKKIFDCRIFSICESTCLSPAGRPGVYTIIDAADWVVVVPVIDTPAGRQFVMVWQWRHGSGELSLEFPGGVSEPGENPAEAAARELQEETGYKPGSIKKIGEFSPNPAIMTNRVHFFLAGDLQNTGKQDLDEDEYVEVALVDPEEVFRGMGQPPYVHALMGSALSLYLRGL
ncbi:MAG: NUDIX hydrolase [Treponema sp.]|jgi:8-oxo-dGTP pyrophosphatase MutT (NUDIX family)|nr:NUDIX hydrolase [Treponema sp.]